MDESEYEAAVRRLATEGIKADNTGHAEFTPEASQRYTVGPWFADASPAEILGHTPGRTSFRNGQGTKLHARIMRGLFALRATDLFMACSRNLI
eukprot:2565290-Karenia_brevis.AAC.1